MPTRADLKGPNELGSRGRKTKDTEYYNNTTLISVNLSIPHFF